MCLLSTDNYLRQAVKFTTCKHELQQYFEEICKLNKTHLLRKTLIKILSFVKKSVSFSLTIEQLTAKRFRLKCIAFSHKSRIVSNPPLFFVFVHDLHLRYIINR